MLRDNSDRNWNRIGKDNPYFSVHTDEKYLTENLTDDTREEFLAVGEKIIARFAETIKCEFPRCDFRCHARFHETIRRGYGT